jgi:flagellar basal-body rod protein FlgB
MGLTELMGATGTMVRLALDAASVRHLAIASNIANANTPGYVPLRVEFEEHLAAAVREGRLPERGLAPTVIAERDGADAVGAKVQLDVEAARLAQNVLHYQALLKGLRGKMEILQAAINEGRG